jgi:hypothetical protein
MQFTRAVTKIYDAYMQPSIPKKKRPKKKQRVNIHVRIILITAQVWVELVDHHISISEACCSLTR